MRKNPYVPRLAKIVEIREENYNTKTFTFRFLDGDGFKFTPGEFNLVTICGAGESTFTVASKPGMKDLQNTIRKVGKLTKTLFNMNIGDKVGIRGPYGKPWPLREIEGKDIVIVAGGIGLAPLRPVIYYIAMNRDRYGHVDLLYGARTPKDMIYTSEMDEWRRVKDFNLQLTVDYVPPNVEWTHKVGVVTVLLKEIEADLRNTVALICGPEIMMKFTAYQLHKMGISDGDIYLSMERRMRCGIGKCGHCQIGPKFVCMDGPTFSYKEVRLLPDAFE